MAKKQVQINETDEWVDSADEAELPTDEAVDNADAPLDLSTPDIQVVAIAPAETDDMAGYAQVVTAYTNERLTEAIAVAERADTAAAEALARAKGAWNEVFFIVKALKPLSVNSQALRESKLGALLDKLP